MGFSTEILALAALILGVFAWLRHDIKSQGQRLGDDIRSQGQRIDAQGQRLDRRIDALAGEVKSMAERLSRIEGLLEGLWRPWPWPG